MLHVAHVITGLGVGGAEMALTRLVERLASEEVRTSVFVLGPEGPLAERIRRAGATVTALGFSPRWPSPLRLLRLAWALRAARPDVVQTWMYHADLLGGLAGRLATSAPVAWNLRNSTLDAEGTPRATWLVVRACITLSRRVPQRIASCSRTALELHAGLGYPRDCMTWIPNGFDLDVLRPDEATRAEVRAELGVGDDALLVGSFARFSPQKDFATLLRAVAAAPPEVTLIAAGGGVTTGTLELARLVEEAGVTSRVQLLGPREDVPRLLRAMDLVTTSSAWGEAFPQVVGEAMASGVPCVVTDVGDSADIVGDTGLVVPPRSPQKLAAAWMRLLSQSARERRELGERARARVRERYELGAIAHRWLAFWREMVNEHPR